MKRTLCCLLGLAVGITLLFVHLPAQAITIGFEPVARDVILGDTAVVDLVIWGLGDGEAESLSAFDLDVDFNAAILSFSSATFGDPDLGDQLDVWGLGASLYFATPGTGSLNLTGLSMDYPGDLVDRQAPAFTLATLTFDTVGLGISALTIETPSLLEGPYFGDAAGNPLQATLNTASVNVNSNPVPEPTTMLIFATGLAGLVGLRRKAGKQRKQQ